MQLDFSVKQCTPSGCGKHYPAFMFGKDKSRKDGLNPYCQPCSIRKGKKYYAKYRANGQARWRKLKANFGVSKEDYEAMWEAQGKCCAICKTTEARGRGDFHLDHNHQTNKARGILCAECNVGIGKLLDSPKVLKSALAYLEEKGCYGEV
jgi:hypothetical protein